MQKSRPTSQRHRAAFVVLFFGSIGGKKVLKKFCFLGEKAKTGVFLRIQKPRGLINQGWNLGNTAISFTREGGFSLPLELPSDRGGQQCNSNDCADQGRYAKDRCESTTRSRRRMRTQQRTPRLCHRASRAAHISRVLRLAYHAVAAALLRRVERGIVSDAP